MPFGKILMSLTAITSFVGYVVYEKQTTGANPSSSNQLNAENVPTSQIVTAPQTPPSTETTPSVPRTVSIPKATTKIVHTTPIQQDTEDDTPVSKRRTLQKTTVTTQPKQVVQPVTVTVIQPTPVTVPQPLPQETIQPQNYPANGTTGATTQR